MAVHEYPLSHGSLAGLSDTDHHKQYALPDSGPASSRPNSAWRFGRLYYATDTGGLSFDQGAGWLDLPSTQYANTWAAAQTFSDTTSFTGLATFSSSVSISSPTVNDTALHVTGLEGQFEHLIAVTRWGKTYDSFRVQGSNGLTCAHDGMYIEAPTTTSIGLQVKGWSNSQTGDQIRSVHNNGTILMRSTMLGEVITSGGIRAGVTGVSASTQATSSGVDLFIDSLFA